MDPREFFDELKRRNVFTVAVAYVVGGWALAEGISQVFPVFDIPNSVVRLIVLFIVLGFPVALVLSWFFDLTRYGIVRTPDRAPEAKINIVGPSNLAEKSIAVLPFENLSEEKANAYFASGMGGRSSHQARAVGRVEGDLSRFDGKISKPSGRFKRGRPATRRGDRPRRQRPESG